MCDIREFKKRPGVFDLVLNSGSWHSGNPHTMAVPYSSLAVL
jgi:hypothetical protein